MVSDQQEFEAVVEHLEKELPAVGHSALELTARTLLGENIEQPTHSLAWALLDVGVPTADLLSVLHGALWQSVQRQLEHGGRDDLGREIYQISERMRRYDVLQRAVIEVADQGWKGSLDKEVKDRVLDELYKQWRKSGEVHLHNYFEEIPVAARVRFLGLQNDVIYVSLNRDLVTMFAAAADMRTAMIISPDRKHSLVASGLKKSEGRILLQISGAEESVRERRRDIRVRLAKPIPVVLVHEEESYQGVIVDISCTGIGIQLDKGSELERDDLVSFSFQLGSHEVAGRDAMICWTHEVGHHHRLGLRFAAKSIRRELIYRFVFVQQQAIIHRLRKLEIPAWMKDPIELRDGQ